MILVKRIQLLLLVLAFSLSIGTSNLWAQSVSFELPDDMVVCQSEAFSIIITNDGNAPLSDIELELILPCQIEYVSGSVQGSFTKDESDLNQPVFTVPDLQVGATATIRIELFAPCDNLICIDNADVFFNTAIVRHNLGQKETDSDFYVVETALPVITRIEAPILSGAKGEVIERKIYIRNSRPGYLDSLRFIDTYKEGLEIKSDIGIDLSSSSGIFELLLTGNEFRRFGDGDDLFEFNEEICITETIKIDACGFDVSAIRSDLHVEWGCQNSICPSPFIPQTALINLEFNITEGPILEVFPFVQNPCCYCSTDPTQQSILIRNLDNFHFASTIVLSVSTEGYDGSFFQDVPIEMETSSGTISLSPFYSISEGNSCSSGESFFRRFYVIIPEIAPGEEVILSWNTIFCNHEDCNDKLYEWDYAFTYSKECTIPGDVFHFDGAVAISELPYLLVTSFGDSPDFEYLDQELIELRIASPFLDKKSGTLDVSIEFSCQLDVTEEDWLFGGVSPSSISESTSNISGNFVYDLQYDLPLDFTNDTIRFEVQFLCTDNCDDGFCEEVFISSCLSPCESEIFLFDIITTTSLNFDECNNECLIQSCDFQIFSYDCNIPICETVIDGYLDSSFELYRLNIGEADNDNDHFADGSGEVDLSLIRLDRAITGDTIRAEINAEVIIDLPGASFEKGILDITTKMIRSNGLDLTFQFLEYAKLIHPAIGFINFSTSLEIIDASSGNSYLCDDVPYFTLDSSGIRAYDIDLTRLINRGCDIPIDYKYENGDSIKLIADFFINYNIKSLLLNYGSIELEFLNVNSIFNGQLEDQSDLFVCQCPRKNMEVANYKTVVTTNGVDIDCCYGESAAGGFSKILKFGTFTDFFPYEYKPAVILENLLMPRVEGLSLLESKLISVRSNDEIVLVDMGSPSTYIDIDLSNVINDTIEIENAENVSGFYKLNPTKDLNLSWDDNLELRVLFNYKNENCLFQGDVDYPGKKEIEFAPGILHTNFEVNLEHQTILLGKQPVLDLNIDLCEVTSFSDRIEWEFQLSNTIFNNALLDSFTENIWFHPISENEQLSQFVLEDIDNGIQIDKTNDIFQIGRLYQEEIKNFRLTAINASCTQEEIRFRFGWACESYTSIDSSSCFEDEVLCLGTSPPGVVDMLIDSSSTSAPLCDTMPWLEIEIFNAGLGPLVNLELSAILPFGLFIEENTSQIEYTSGTQNFISISDPIDMSNNIVVWSIDKDVLDIQTEGLQGVNSFPQNSITFRFKTRTNCDFISGSRIIYDIAANKLCGEPSNTVSKISGKLQIFDAVPSYTASIGIEHQQVSPCSDTLEIQINILANSITGFEDNLAVQLPEGLSYVPGSCSGDLSDCNPIQNDNLLVWPLSAGLQDLSINFQLIGLEDQDCDLLFIPIYTTTQIDATCLTDNMTCGLKISTGEIIARIPIKRPIFEIDNIEISDLESDNTVSSLNITISNQGEENSDSVRLSLYLDDDRNGTVSDGDIFIADYSFDEHIENGNQIELLISNLDLTIDQLCQIIILIDEDKNCICIPDEGLNDKPIIIKESDIHTICSGDSILIGIDSLMDHNYQWQSSKHISCSECSVTSFSAINPGFQKETFFLTLEDINKDGCQVHYIFQVDVAPQPRIWSEAHEICLGEETTILASDASNYNWEGDGIVDPSLQVQIVSPSQTSNYYVSITDHYGCTAVDSAEVIVIDLPVVSAGEDILLCFGQQAQLEVMDPDSSFEYAWFPGSPFLDDPSSLTPEVLINQDNGFILTAYDGQCSSSDTVFLEFYDGFDFVSPEEIIICKGDEINLQLEEGNSYDWNPSFIDMCVNEDCSIVSFSPEFSLTISVIGINDSLCVDTSFINIIVLDSGSAVTEEMQICEGDTVLIFGELYTEAGLYCDTLINLDGCLQIECIDLSFYIPEELDITASDLEVEIGSSVQLNATTGFLDYSWQFSEALSCFDCPDPLAIINFNEIFYLAAIDINGCLTMDSIEIRAVEICDVEDILIPNAFTPNDNGKNDFFRIANMSQRLLNVSIEVYDRWGELLFFENGNTGWDGNYNNNKVPEGVYLYIIRVDCGDGTEKMYKGNISLIR